MLPRTVEIECKEVDDASLCSAGLTYSYIVYDVCTLQCGNIPPPSLRSDVPDDQPDVRVLASVSNASGDGFYSFSNDSSVVLDPPVKDFFESFNAINWTISRLDRTGASNNVKVVIQENPMVSRTKQ